MQMAGVIIKDPNILGGEPVRQVQEFAVLLPRPASFLNSEIFVVIWFTDPTP
jgi:hypothetical protein